MKTLLMLMQNQLVLQGSVFGPLKCCVQIDTLGRDRLAEDKGLLKYNATSCTY